MKLKNFISVAILASTMVTASAYAKDYVIDTKGAHAFIQFRIQHLGYSWLYGRFNEFSGEFSYDKNAPEKSSIQVKINTKSLDSNHADRDKHLRSSDFLDTGKYPSAKFISTKYTSKDKSSGTLEGKLTLHGVTKAITIDVQKIGEGKDPWGGYRAGFEGTTTFNREDFGITKNLGPKSKNVEMILSIEGIRK
jgi:polyisoprenoid-binding protein YceI